MPNLKPAAQHMLVPAIVVPIDATGLEPGVYTNARLSKIECEQLAGRARLWQYRDHHRRANSSPTVDVSNFIHLQIHIGVDDRQWAKLLLAVVADAAYSVDI